MFCVLKERQRHRTHRQEVNSPSSPLETYPKMYGSTSLGDFRSVISCLHVFRRPHEKLPTCLWVSHRAKSYRRSTCLRVSHGAKSYQRSTCLWVSHGATCTRKSDRNKTTTAVQPTEHSWNHCERGLQTWCKANCCRVALTGRCGQRGVVGGVCGGRGVVKRRHRG